MGGIKTYWGIGLCQTKGYIRCGVVSIGLAFGFSPE